MKVKIKKEKGITLIALVVTIVVLLILAAIAIGMLMGENGVIKKAEESKEETTKGKERELIKLAYQNLEMERQTNGIEITTDRIGNKMKEYDEKTKAKGIEEEEIGEKEIVVTRLNSSGYAEIEYEETGHKYIVPLIVNTNEVYSIKYNLDGGTDSGNPTQYTPTQTITLNPPTKSWNKFTGWTGSNGTTLEKIVVIPRGSTGNKEYTAHWEEIEPICKIGETKYASVQEAIEACSKSAGEETTTIIMLKSTEEEFNTYEGQNITLDLQGKLITSSSTSKPLCTNNGKLQIIDNSSGKTGKLESTKGTTIQNNTTGAITIGDNSTNIDNNTPTIYGKQIGIKTDGEFNFYDGKIQGITPIQGNVTKTPEGFGPVTTDYTDGITTMQLGIVSGYEARIDWVYYTTVQEAVDATKTDTKETVTILKDIQLKDVLQISDNKNMILDLNGYQLTIVSEKDKVIDNYGQLEITDSNSAQTGNITISSSKKNYSIYNNGTGTLTIKSGTVSNTSSNSVNKDRYGIYNKNTGNIIIEGGTITSSDYGIYNGNAGNITIKGGTITSGDYGIYNASIGNITVEGGTITTINIGSRSVSYGIYNKSTGNVIVTGGTISAKSNSSNDDSYCYGIYNEGIGDVIVGGIIEAFSTTTASYDSNVSYGIYNYGEGNVKVKKGGIVRSSSDKRNNVSYGIYNRSTGNVIVEGGTVSSNANNSSGNGSSKGIYNGGTGNIEITEGGIINSNSSSDWDSCFSDGIYNKDGNVTVKVGKIESISGHCGDYDDSSGYGIRNQGTGNVIIEEGGIVSGIGKTSGYGIYNSDGNITIGNKNETVAQNSPNIKGTSNGISNTSGNLEFYNGMIQGSIALAGNITKIREGYEIENSVIEQKDTIYLIEQKEKEYIVQVDENKYYTLTEAIESITNGTEKTMIVLKDFKLGENVVFNKNIILNLNGYEIINKYYKIENIGNLKIVDTTENKIGNIKSLISNKDSGSITIEGGTINNSIKNYSIGNITVKGGNINGSIYNASTGNIIIEEGTVNNNSERSNGEYGIYNVSTGNVEVKRGGTVSNTSNSYGHLHSGSYGIYNSSTGNVIIEGRVENSEKSNYSKSYGIYNSGTGKIEIKSGGIVNSNGKSSNIQNYGIYNNSTGNIEVKEGGTISSNISNYTSNSYGIYNNSTGNITVEGRIIASDESKTKKDSKSYGIYNNSTGNVEIRASGIVDSNTTSYDSYGIYNSNTGNITIERGIVNSNSERGYGIYNKSTGSITIGTKGDGIKTKDEIYIKGKKYGIYNNKGKLYFYDGQIEGEEKAVYDIITEWEEGAELNYNEDETILTLTTEIRAIAQKGEVTYTNLQEAINEVGENQETIKILRNVTYTNKDSVITNNKNIIIDLNGYKIASTIPEKVIKNGGTLEIIDTSTDKTGEITTNEQTTIENIEGARLIITDGKIENRTKHSIYNKGELEIKGGTVSISNSSDSNSSNYAIYNSSTGNVTIKGGTVNSENNNGYYNYNYTYGVYNSSTGNVVVESGTVNAGLSKSYGIYNSSTGNVIIKEGAIVKGEIGSYNTGEGYIKVEGGTVSGYYYGIYNSSTGNVTVERGIVSSSSYKHSYGIYNNSTGNIIIGKKGDKQILSEELLYIKGKSTDTSSGYGIYNYNQGGKIYYYDGKIAGTAKAIGGNIQEVEEKSEMVITSETIDSREHETARLEEKETNGVIVDDIEYDSIQRAIDENNENEIVIRLTRDVNPAATIVIEENQNIIIDLNGYTMRNYPEMQNKGTLKIIDTSESKSGKIVGLVDIVIMNTRTIQLEGGIIIDSGYGIKNQGEAIIKGGKIENNTYGIYNDTNGNTTIMSGVISSNTYGVYNYSGTTNIQSTEIADNEYGIYNSGGNINISGNMTGEEYGIYNSGGTINIKEGAQISAKIGIHNDKGTVTVGEQGAMNPDSPVITGEEYGLINSSTATVNMYDGQIKGKTGATQGYITKTETGYIIANRTEGEYKVDYLALEGTVSTVAQVNGVNYSNLQSAINSIVGQEQQTIKLTNGIITTTKLQINEGQNIILDMNGKTISSDLEITLENAGTLTIIDTTGSNVAKLTSTAGIAIKNSGTLTIGEDDGTENANMIIIEGLENIGTLNKYDGTIN